MRNQQSSPITGTSGSAKPATTGHERDPRSMRRRMAVVGAGVAVCALGGVALAGLGGATGGVASASGIVPTLPSGFPSGTPGLPDFPPSVAALTAALTSVRPVTGQVTAHGNGASVSASARSTGALLPVPGRTGGVTGVTSLVPTAALPAAGLPTTGGTALPIPPSAPSVPSLPVSQPAGLPAVPTIPGVPSLPVAALVPTGGGTATTCVSTPALPASPLGAVPVSAGGTGSLSAPLGGVDVTVSTSGASVCAG